MAKRQPELLSRRTVHLVRQARNAERYGPAIRDRRTTRVASRRLLARLAATETGGGRPGIERNGHQCISHRETARAAGRRAAGKAAGGSAAAAAADAAEREQRHTRRPSW